MGGFLASRLGHIPRPGESYLESDLRFTVEEADRRRVYRVKIEPAPSLPLSPVPQPEPFAAARLKAHKLTADS
jgi:magnesium and cobalt transporter